MTNKEKFLALVSTKETKTVERAKARLARRSYTRLSKKIALRILMRLDELGRSQVDLAKEMEVSRQQVNKWVKGQENFTIATLEGLGDVLGIELVQVPSRSDVKVASEVKLPTATSKYKVPERIRSIIPVVEMRAVV